MKIVLKRELLRSLLSSCQAYAFLGASLIIPSFFTLGKIHFLLPLIYIWALRLPQKLPWLVLLLEGAFQDILLELPWGTHGIFYSIFLYIVLSQRSSLYNRSFILKWTAFGIIITFTQAGMLTFLHVLGKLPSLSESILYSLLIPFLSFPLFSQLTQKYLIGLQKHHVS